MRKSYVLVSLTVLLAVMVFSCASSGGGGGGGGGAASKEPVVAFNLDFSDPAVGINGWTADPNEFYDHKGTVELSLDNTTFGKGMLRLDVDFTRDKGSEWSEPKLKYAFTPPVDMTGVTHFTYTILYNPELSSGGHFKSKVIGKNGSRDTAGGESDVINAKEDAGNGFLKATVSLRARTSGLMDGMIFSIAGYKTDYKGPVFFENMRWESK